MTVCVDRPILSLDRPFTYDLPPELGAGVGSLVRFRFHGKLSTGWVLGTTEDIPARMLPLQRLVSPVRFFDDSMLALARWVSERYVAPLATVLGRLSPPRVASEDDTDIPFTGAPDPTSPATALAAYAGGTDLLDLCRRGAGAMALRPAPEEEQMVAVEAVAACLRGGRRALVLVPEASPLPGTAAALVRMFGERVAVFAGGDRRTRYRTWRAIQAGAADVVVGTRPAVFAPLPGLGLIYVARESHPGHREERAPHYHVREVAIARAKRDGAAVVLAALCHSSDVAALGLRTALPRGRVWPKVEVVRPGSEGKAPRLVQALREATRGFVFSPMPGYGTAQICRTCRSAAVCGVCGGTLRLEEGSVRCVVCQAPGRCATCGAERFGIRRGGAERVTEWASGLAHVPVREVARPRLPRANEILVGGPEDVRDLGPGGLDLVAIIDADASGRRPGLASRERTLATWMEAAAWAQPGGRVIVQSSDPGDVMIQALVRGNPDRFLARERERREEAGFPVGAPVFRVVGDDRLEEEVIALAPRTVLVSSIAGRTVCLLALEPGRLRTFGAAMRRLAVSGVVERVEAEPHL